MEDNPGDARLLRAYLAEADAASFQLTHEERLSAAIERLAADSFDVVLLDLSLPDSHGLDTLRRAHAATPSTPIVVLTGYDDETQAVRAVVEGAQDYLVKGNVDSNLLVRSMRYAVERQRMVAELEEARLKEHHVATHDILTDLPNRQLFQDRLGRALAEADRRGEKVAVLFLDLDRFKLTNDTLGHAIGDRLLRSVGRRLVGCIRGGDTAARLGGDEFTIILTGVKDVGDVNRVAEKVLTALRAPFRLGGQELLITTSIGVSLFPDDGRDTDTLLKHADVAMYRAKAGGRNTFQFFAPEMNERAFERMELERSLRLALDRSESCFITSRSSTSCPAASSGWRR